MKKILLVFLILALGIPLVFFEEPPQSQADDTAQMTPAPTPSTIGPTKKKKSKHSRKTRASTLSKSEAAPAAITEAKEKENPLYIGLGTGVDFPGSNWYPYYRLGGEAAAFVGYRLDKNFAVQLDGEAWLFTGTGYSLFNLRVLAEAKYTFDGQGWRPYLLAGPGMVLQDVSPVGDSTINFDALAGIGAEFDVAPQTHLFIEAKYNFIMTETTTFTDIPVSAGIWVGL